MQLRARFVALLFIGCAHAAQPVSEEEAYLPAHEVPPSWLNAMVAGLREPLAACVGAGPYVMGKMVTGVRIQPDGSVRSVRCVCQPGVEDRVRDCVQQAIEKWRFRSTGNGEGAEGFVTLHVRPEGFEFVATRDFAPVPPPAPSAEDIARAKARDPLNRPLPGPPPPMPRPAVRGELPVDAVNEVIRAHRGELNVCKQLSASSGLGALTLHLDVGPNGDVVGFSVLQADVPQPMLDCLRVHVRRWQFPRPTGGGAAAVEFQLLVDDTQA